MLKKHEILKNITSKPVPLPDSLSPEAKSLLHELFRIKPKDRLGAKNDAEDIKNHKFFADINFEDVENKLIKPPIAFIESEINDLGFE